MLVFRSLTKCLLFHYSRYILTSGSHTQDTVTPLILGPTHHITRARSIAILTDTKCLEHNYKASSSNGSVLRHRSNNLIW